MKRIIPCLFLMLTLCACGRSQAVGMWVYTYPDGDADTLELTSKGSFCCTFWDGEQKSGEYSLDEGKEGGMLLKLSTEDGTQYLNVSFEKDSMTLAGKTYIKQ